MRQPTYDPHGKLTISGLQMFTNSFFSLCGLLCGLTIATRRLEGLSDTPHLEGVRPLEAVSTGDNFIFLSAKQKYQIKNGNELKTFLWWKFKDNFNDYRVTHRCEL
jgi:hypothetical protein